ncbi:MAG: endonuclease/exonuclease/phosphatase family protein [Gaiellaceae bacterium]
MAVLVRSWNLFHGNTVPPGRQDRLEEMIRLAAADEPAVLCLQEIPVWALERLDEWSGMAAWGVAAAPPRLGPLPSTAEVGRAITELGHGRSRSAFTGQANAILVSARLRTHDRHTLVLNSVDFRRRQANWLGLPLVARLAWAKERRVCQAVRVALPRGGAMLVANLHATSYRPDERLADAELLRAAVFADALARPEETCVLAGDFNVKAERSWTLGDLTGPDWGFSAPGPWLDHVLVRGAAVSATVRWPDERRRRGELLLSDHAPVEVEVG